MQLNFSVREAILDNNKPVQIGRFDLESLIDDALEDIAEEVDSRDLDTDAAMQYLEEALEEDPEDLQAYNILCALYWNDGIKDLASEFYEKAYKLALEKIPAGFKGQIPWGESENRVFLEIAHGWLLCLMHEEKGRSAYNLANKLLRWDPADNLGTRFLIGDIKFIQGDYFGAMKHYLDHTDTRPTNWYQAALIAFRDEDLVAACTHLRRGIAWNPYVAEGILGRTLFADHFYWHGTNRENAQSASEYLEAWPREWSDEETDFVDWVFNHSSVLRERAAITEIREKMSHKQAPESSKALIEERNNFMRGIDDTLSADLVKPIMNRWGEAILPWDRVGHNGPADVRTSQVY